MCKGNWLQQTGISELPRDFLFLRAEFLGTKVESIPPPPPPIHHQSVVVKYPCSEEKPTPQPPAAAAMIQCQKLVISSSSSLLSLGDRFDKQGSFQGETTSWVKG